MLSKEAVNVLQHFLAEGLSKTAIARKLGVSRRTVQRYAKSGKPVVPPGECGTLPADQCPRPSKTS